MGYGINKMAARAMFLALADCMVSLYTSCVKITYMRRVHRILALAKPESNMLKNLPKILSGISHKFHLLCFSVFLLCLHYSPKLPTILSIVMEKLKY